MDTLADALRAWRERADPADAGLPRGADRRTPGLRREELAVLAGISVEYVVRLEQGRTATPSAQVCLALARALRLSDDEQRHLLRLAGHGIGPNRILQLIPSSVSRILERLEAQPLSVYDASWRLLHWNPLFAATFGDPTTLSDDRRNLLVLEFEGRDDRLAFAPGDRDAFRASLVADLRSTSGRYPDDPDLRSLVARLRRNAEFSQLWEAGAVARHRSGAKTVRHPNVGDIQLDSDVLTTSGSDLRVVVYTPRPGTDARSKLELLSAIGPQSGNRTAPGDGRTLG